jgi:hypothetical protein
MLMCPWCEEWHPLESYIVLAIPPNHPEQCSPVYKHGGEGGCKKLFSLDLSKV